MKSGILNGEKKTFMPVAAKKAVAEEPEKSVAAKKPVAKESVAAKKSDTRYHLIQVPSIEPIAYPVLLIRQKDGNFRGAIMLSRFEKVTGLRYPRPLGYEDRCDVSDGLLAFLKQNHLFQKGPRPILISLSALCEQNDNDPDNILFFEILKKVVLKEANARKVALCNRTLAALHSLRERVPESSVASVEQEVAAPKKALVAKVSDKPIRKRSADDSDAEDVSEKSSKFPKMDGAARHAEQMIAEYIESRKSTWRTQFFEENAEALKQEYFQRMDNILAIAGGGGPTV